MVSLATRRLASTRFPEKGGLWKEVLAQATRTAQFPSSHIILLGRKDVGKSSIIRALQRIGGGAQQKMSDMETYQDNDGVSALDYAYINVRNLDDEDTTESLAKTNVWILQDEQHKDLLLRSLSPEFLKHALILICVDLSEPWLLKEDATFWLDFAVKHIPELFQNVAVEDQETMRDKLSHYIRTYKPNVTRESAHDFAMRHRDDSNGEQLTIGENGVLSVNLGIPIVLCVCKSDSAPALDTRTTRGYIDVIEAHLRKLCLQYGAALIFCNAKDALSARNLNLLYQYIMHRIYGLDFGEPASDDHKDAIFFPSGWDAEQQIDDFAKTTLAEGFARPYGSIIHRKPPPGVNEGNLQLSDERKAIDVEDMHTFLGSQLAAVPSLAATSSHSTSGRHGSSAGGAPRVRERRTSRTEGETSRGPATTRRLQQQTPQEGGTAGNTARGDPASLRSFFQTLLVRGQQKPNSPRPEGNLAGEKVNHSAGRPRGSRGQQQPQDEEEQPRLSSSNVVGSVEERGSNSTPTRSSRRVGTSRRSTAREAASGEVDPPRDADRRHIRGSTAESPTTTTANARRKATTTSSPSPSSSPSRDRGEAS